MKNYAIFLLFWTALGPLSAGAAIPLAERPNHTNFNTPVKVLLDRETPVVKVRSPFSHLFLRDDSNAWREVTNFLEVVYKRIGGKPTLWIPALQASYSDIFLRGGPYGSDKLQYHSNYYRGALRLTAREKGILVTNVVSLDDYLIGILPSEMIPSWEMEALKAQAVASRTYVLYMMDNPKNPYYDLESTTQDQVYGGADVEAARAKIAVESTKGEILSLRGRPIKAYFHSRCGGVTETARTVWNERRGEHLTRVVCPYCQKHPFEWRVSVPLREFFSSLKVSEPIRKPFSLMPALKTPSGRTTTVLLASGTNAIKISGDQLRGALGYERLKSTLLNWKIENDHIHFAGLGHGHGVGMCQFGARYLAKLGRTYKEILAHYYPGTAPSPTPQNR